MTFTNVAAGPPQPAPANPATVPWNVPSLTNFSARMYPSNTNPPGPS